MFDLVAICDVNSIQYRLSEQYFLSVALAVLLHTSLLLITILGAEAVGGVLSVTTVLESAAFKIEGINTIKVPIRDSFKNLIAFHHFIPQVRGRPRSM